MPQRSPSTVVLSVDVGAGFDKGLDDVKVSDFGSKRQSALSLDVLNVVGLIVFMLKPFLICRIVGITCWETPIYPTIKIQYFFDPPNSALIFDT